MLLIYEKKVILEKMSTYSKNYKSNHFLKNNQQISIRKVDLLTMLRVLFGGIFFLFGFSLLVFGLFFVIIFGSFVSFSDLRFTNSNPTVRGKIINIERTSATNAKKPIYKYSYTYEVNGKKYQGVSYAVGEQDNDIVLVQYLPDEPNVSRIKGMKNSEMPLVVLFFLLIFPVIGLLLLILALKKNVIYLRLLRFGKLTFGVLSDIERTNFTVNERPVYRAYFKFFTSEKVEGVATGETHLIEKLSDEKYEPLIYNPLNPNEAVMIDSLPAVVRRFLRDEIEKERQQMGSSEGQN